MNYFIIELPDGYGDRLKFLSKETGIPISDLIRFALDSEYIMTEEQLKPLPF